MTMMLFHLKTKNALHTSSYLNYLKAREANLYTPLFSLEEVDFLPPSMK